MADDRRFKAIRILAETATLDELPELAGAIAEAGAIVARRLFTDARPPAAETVGPELVDAVELGRRLSLPATWVRDAARQGRIPSVKVGHYRRFDADAVIEWMRRK